MVLLSQNAQRPLFHLLGLPGGLVKPRLKVRAPMLPGLANSGFHVVGQDDELRRSAVIMDAKLTI